MPHEPPTLARERPASLERRLHHFRFEEHVPEALGPVEIDDQKQAAQHDLREGHPVADPRQATVLRSADQLDERGGMK